MASLADKINANKRLGFTCEGMEIKKFSVVNMEGYEAISRPFRFTLTLVTDDVNVDFDKMLETSCSLRIFAPDGASDTPYHGVLIEFEQLHQADNYVFYRAVLVPRLWRLSLCQSSEVYLNEQTIPQILETLLKNGGLTSADYEFKLTGLYRARSYVCQYQESAFNFLSRWMEKEGIAYYFDHSGAREKLIIVDDKQMHPADTLEVSYRPLDQLDTGTDSNSVHGFVCRQQALPKTLRLQDYNHRRADLPLSAEAIVSERGYGEVMLYGENFRDKQEGERYARIRAEELRCQGKVYLGDGSAVGLRSGQFIKMTRHYRDDVNDKFLVTEITHSGSQAGALLTGIRHPFSDNKGGGETSYQNNFSALQADIQFRPARNTPKPRVAGTMNATVDAEGSGDYAELDEFGQYKLQLPFDRSDKSANKGSARVRMATPYSGKDHGMHFPLHKNAEVLLSFIDGDPDHPIILGAVPNSENPSVVSSANSTHALLRSSGGNQIKIEDKADAQHIHLSSPQLNTSLSLGNLSSAVNDPPTQASPEKTGYPNGIHAKTKGTIGLEGRENIVMTTIPFEDIKEYVKDKESFNVHAKKIKLCVWDNTKKPIYTYEVQKSAEGDPSPAWDMEHLEELDFDDHEVNNCVGVTEVTHQNKTTFAKADVNNYTKGNSARVTEGDSTSLTRGNVTNHFYGNNTSVTRGDATSETHGTTTSHYHGLNNSLFKGAKNSLTMGADTSTVLGLKNSATVGLETSSFVVGKVTLSLGQLVTISAGQVMNLGSLTEIDTNFAKVETVNEKFKAAMMEIETVETMLTASITSIRTRVFDLENSELKMIV